MDAGTEAQNPRPDDETLQISDSNSTIDTPTNSFSSNLDSPQSRAISTAINGGPAYTINVKNLCYQVPAKSPAKLFPGVSKPAHEILKNISFKAKPGEILAIVGPSGAGKSTLLEILAGRLKPRAPCIAINGGRSATPSQLRKISAYVTQEDALLPLLTVRETLMFSAELRLPSKTFSAIDKQTKVHKIMAELGLLHVAESRVGDENVRGLSGGEKRRVSIGVELIHDPKVLLLDEPTSGLDSAAALNIVEILQNLAAGQIKSPRTIITSIHQPGYRILNLISSLVLISDGSVLHHGTLKSLQTWLESSSWKLPVQLNALEYAMELIPELVPASEIAPSSPEFQISNSSAASSPRSVADSSAEISFSYANSRISEILTLSRRFCMIIYRTHQLFLARTLQALVAGFGLGSVYFNVGFSQKGLDERLGFFAFTLTFLLSSTTEGLPIFLQERRILMKETSRGSYRISSYVISNALVFIPFLLIVAILFSIPVYFLVGLSPTPAAFFFFLFTVWLIVVMANSLVVFLSALAPDFITGNSLIFTVLGAFFLFSGYFIAEQSIPKYWLFMHYLSLYKYPLDSLMINEYGSLRHKCFAWYPQTKICVVTGQDILARRGLHEHSKWTNIQIMVAFAVFYRILCYFVLRRRASGANK